MGRGHREKRPQANLWDEFSGYMASKISKLETQTSVDSKEGMFNGVAIFVNGYTEPSSDELMRLIQSHGGKFHHYYSRHRVTHIIASNLPNSKIEKLNEKVVVKPQWILDSITAGQRLGVHKYQISNTAKLGSVTSFTTTRKTNPNNTNARETVSDAMGNSSIATPRSVEDPESTGTSGRSRTDKDTSGRWNFSSPSKLVSSSDSVAHSSLDSATRNVTEGVVSEFYRNSRLHHISQWGAELKQYVQQLQTENPEGEFPDRDGLRINQNMSAENATKHTETAFSRRVVMHVDMDCFFVSVGLRKHPHLRGRPVAVTSSKGNSIANPSPQASLDYERAYYTGKNLIKEEKLSGMSEARSSSSSNNENIKSMADIASCSYEARKAGVKNGMVFGSGRKLCPELVPIPYDFEAYNEVSRVLYNTVAKYTLSIEAVSCDELLVDCTDLLADTGIDAVDFAVKLRQLIYDQTQCCASVGIGPNILLARLATRKAKPDNYYEVRESDCEEFIRDIQVQLLPGVGRTLVNKLSNLSVNTCADLQRIPLNALQKQLGPKTGQSLHRFAFGKDDRQLNVSYQRKSVSAEMNYAIRLTTESDLEKFIGELSIEVTKRLEKLHVLGKSITIKVKTRKEDAPKETAKFMGHGVCDNHTKTHHLPLATNQSEIIAKHCMLMLRTIKKDVTDYRGLGIQMSKLEDMKRSAANSITNFTKVMKPGEQLMKHDDERRNCGMNDDRQPMASRSSPQPSSSTNDYHPQVDLEMLKLMPEDIQQEYLDEVKKSEVENAKPKGTKKILALPNIDDIDKNCLDALPVELQRELRSAYSKQNEAKPCTVKKALIQHKKAKAKSPRKKLLTKKIQNKTPLNQQTLLPSIVIGSKSSEHTPLIDSVITSTHTSPCKDTTPTLDSTTHHLSSCDEMSTENANLQCSEVSIGGATALSDVKLLLKEWVTTNEAPGTKDIAEFSEYMCALVLDKNLEQVYLLLKYFKRILSCYTEEHVWIQCGYKVILENVQAFVINVHGGPLKL